MLRWRSLQSLAILALLAFAASSASAQFQQRRPTPNDTLKSTEVGPDGKVTFRIYAPKAEEVTVGGETAVVHENESAYIPIGSVHRMANPGKIPLELIEVQVGSYLGEDDIQRLEDTYGRG